MRLVHPLLLSLVTAGLLACGPQVTPPPDVTPVEDELAPEFFGGGQVAPVGQALYPGPYGIGIGSVMPNYKFFGYPRAMQDKSAMQLIELADFYNPTGEDVYPEGSPYGAGTRKPRGLVLDRSAVWCPPCKVEARDVIPPRRALYFPLGEFFVTLDDGPTAGIVATEADLNKWVTTFNIDYPAVIDPNSTLAAVVGIEAYPGNVLLRTRDMKIIEWETGAPRAGFWAKFEAVMRNEKVLDTD